MPPHFQPPCNGPSTTCPHLRGRLLVGLEQRPLLVLLEARLRHLLRGSTPVTTDVIQYRELSLNVSTYQASIAGRSLDLTYMEYELLKVLAQNPGKVFTREMLLNRVWGYEYYGGARTVDVHVRRLRAKLGPEYEQMIVTVRGVGYKLVPPGSRVERGPVDA